MGKDVGKAFIKVKQAIKRVLKTEKIGAEVIECHKNPELYEEKEEEEEEESEEEEEEKESEEESKKPSNDINIEDLTSSDEDEWDNMSTSSESSSASSDYDNVVYKSKRDKWTLKPKDIEKMEKEKKTEKKEKKEKKITETVSNEYVSTYEYGAKEVVITKPEELIELYCKTIEARGKKVDKNEQITTLTQLYNVTIHQKYSDYYQIMTGLGLVTAIVYLFYYYRLNIIKIQI